MGGRRAREEVEAFCLGLLRTQEKEVQGPVEDSGARQRPSKYKQAVYEHSSKVKNKMSNSSLPHAITLGKSRPGLHCQEIVALGKARSLETLCSPLILNST